MRHEAERRAAAAHAVDGRVVDEFAMAKPNGAAVDREPAARGAGFKVVAEFAPGDVGLGEVHAKARAAEAAIHKRITPEYAPIDGRVALSAADIHSRAAGHPRINALIVLDDQVAKCPAAAGRPGRNSGDRVFSVPPQS